MNNGKNRFSKKMLTLVISLALVFVCAVSGTVALMVRHTSTLQNDFNPGKAVVVIDEPWVDPENVEWGTDTKQVMLTVPEGEDAVDVVVRANISPYADNTGDGSQVLFPGMSRPVRNQIVMGDITLHFDPLWSKNWIYRDGYFYYNKVLKPGETTRLLLTGVTLTQDTPEMRSKYATLKVRLDVTADALQAQAGAPSEWGLTVSGINVSFTQD